MELTGPLQKEFLSIYMAKDRYIFFGAEHQSSKNTNEAIIGFTRNRY